MNNPYPSYSICIISFCWSLVVGCFMFLYLHCSHPFSSFTKMNSGRIHRHYRSRRGVEISREICLRCFQFGHRRHSCRNEPIVTCGKCYRVYIFTQDCLCTHHSKKEMTLRMVAGSTYPRPVIDVTIGIKTYEAFINMSMEITTISFDVFEHINECKAIMNEAPFILPTPVNFPVRRHNKQATLALNVQELQITPVILGMDFFMNIGFTLTADRVSINERSPVMSCPKTIDFLYNQPHGEDLHAWLTENHRPTFSQYTKGEQPELTEEQRVYINNNNINNDNNNNIQDPTDKSDPDVLQLHPSDADLNID